MASMTKARGLAAGALGLALAASGAAAQPLVLPGARLSGLDTAAPSASQAPAAARPVSVRSASEDGLVARDLRLNGRSGSLRLERSGPVLKARITLEGSMASRPTQICTVTLGESEASTLEAAGRPEGAPRYALEAAQCPVTLDVLDGAALVTAPAVCLFEAADCRVDPRGLWGPEPGTLVTQARAIEQARGQADRAVRENYRVLTQRAGPGEVRGIVTEQAAFSSEREQVCRDYVREFAHGFCAARFTEARALSLAARLGVTETVAVRPKRRAAAPSTATQ